MYPHRWVRAVQAKSTRRHRWQVLLDAAAFAPAHPLNLTATPADFVCISFYKLFGYPTGVGAWIVRNEDAHILKKVRACLPLLPPPLPPQLLLLLPLRAHSAALCPAPCCLYICTAWHGMVWLA